MDTFTHGRLSNPYHDTGEGPAPIFLHNVRTSSTALHNQNSDLQPHHRIIAPTPHPCVAPDRPPLADLS